MAATDTNQAAEYEAEHVHQVYEQIADHFSSTRYKVSNTPDLFEAPSS
jgi:tRNA (uracil-5-)-methyltransferase TRM9